MSALTRALGVLARLFPALRLGRAERTPRPAGPGKLRVVAVTPSASSSEARGGLVNGNQLLTVSRLSDPEPVQRRRTPQGADGFMQVLEQTKGALIPFPPASHRHSRPAPAEGEPRGQILLFTGVRYERQPEPGPEPTPSLSSGQPAGRRRRRQ